MSTQCSFSDQVSLKGDIQGRSKKKKLEGAKKKF
jgi:hypothetical protein